MTHFTQNQDRIGIVSGKIDSVDDLILKSKKKNGITTGTILYGERPLAVLPGINAKKLDANSFLFSTDGSIFDKALLTAGSTYNNPLQVPL